MYDVLRSRSSLEASALPIRAAFIAGQVGETSQGAGVPHPMLLPYQIITVTTDFKLSRGGCWGARWAAPCVAGLAVRWMTAVRAVLLLPILVCSSGLCSLVSAPAAGSGDASTSMLCTFFHQSASIEALRAQQNNLRQEDAVHVPLHVLAGKSSPFYDRPPLRPHSVTTS